MYVTQFKAYQQHDVSHIHVLLGLSLGNSRAVASITIMTSMKQRRLTFNKDRFHVCFVEISNTRLAVATFF